MVTKAVWRTNIQRQSSLSTQPCKIDRPTKGWDLKVLQTTDLTNIFNQPRLLMKNAYSAHLTKLATLMTVNLGYRAKRRIILARGKLLSTELRDCNPK